MNEAPKTTVAIVDLAPGRELRIATTPAGNTSVALWATGRLLVELKFTGPEVEIFRRAVKEHVRRPPGVKTDNREPPPATPPDHSEDDAP